MDLTGKRFALLVEDLFQDMEVMYPYYRFKEAGAEVDVVGPKGGVKYTGKYGYPIHSTLASSDALKHTYDAVIVPGGWAPDKLRLDPNMLELVRKVDARTGVVAAICHAGWVLASANIVSGRKVTSYIAIKDDMVHAGAQWVDQEVCVDGNLITSRKPDDLPAFCRAIIQAFL